MSKVRRGVHMTAQAKRAKPGWKEELSDSEDEKLPEDEREASRLDWSAIEKEVKTERDKIIHKEFGSTAVKRVVKSSAYDDVAGDGDDEDFEADRIRRAAEKRKAEADKAGNAEHGPAEAPASADSDDDDARPEGAITAGKNMRDRKRGGKMKTGSSKKKKAEGEEEDEKKKKRRKKEDEDPERWVKLKLLGDEKPKRIDATRVVHYHDFDTLAQGGDDDSAPISTAADKAKAVPAAPVAPPVAPPMGASGGNFRAAIRRDLWDDDDEDE